MQEESTTADTLLQRKKPGRKPNPASPALRKAQNRAAQRAFRERKEKHIMCLEETSKLLREQRDRLEAENRKLRTDVEILGYESWYLKGIALTLQLVCFMHRISIPHHNPYLDINDFNGLLPPETLAAYDRVKNSSKLPSMWRSSSSSVVGGGEAKLYVSSSSILVTKDEVRALSNPPLNNRFPRSSPTTVCNTPTVIDGATINLQCGGNQSTKEISDEQHHHHHPDSPKFSARPIMLTREPVASFNLAGLQTERLRKLLQSACSEAYPSFIIEPTLLQVRIKKEINNLCKCSLTRTDPLQLNVPHDPRIDFIPFPTIRDRLILYQNQIDMHECMRSFVESSSFIGGGVPTTLESWRLEPEFYEKFWFLTHNYCIETIKERWPHAVDPPVLTPDLCPSSDATDPEHLPLRDAVGSASSAAWDDVLSLNTPMCNNDDGKMVFAKLLHDWIPHQFSDNNAHFK